ncbi:XRE family transcriptional regulator [Sodalis praecaptivus]|uniref:XRE family transcriptional regulator n=1 Tax=Sodalis praecaptivus TaxID=1239307 RepID=UPI0027F3DBE8|nr:helix-turn-helix transcriptional regulator [Sodalis praecaptivus]CAJ0997521.1 HTH-type transcriptional regulator PrtR [Sodalis praecaptivus]
MKEMTFADRLNLAMKESGHTQASLGDAVGMSQPSVWKLTSGKSNSTRKLLEISHALNVRPEWLSTGRGPMREDSINSYVAPLEELPDGFKWERVAVWDEHTPLKPDEVEVPLLKDIEFVRGDAHICDEGHDGSKLRFTKEILRRVGANNDGSGVICFPVSGNSMEPMLPDGSTVAIDTNNKRIIDGKIYAIAQDGGSDSKLNRIRQLYRKPGGKLIIHSFNPEEHEEDKESDVEVIGRVFWYSAIL